MKRSSIEILKSIVIVVNLCLEILGREPLKNEQAAVVVAMLDKMAVHPRRDDISFNRKLALVFRMAPGDGRRQALLHLLGLEA